jgi:hypothetical protein
VYVTYVEAGVDPERGFLFKPIFEAVCENKQESLIDPVQLKQSCDNLNRDGTYGARSAKKSHVCWRNRFCKADCEKTAEIVGKVYWMIGLTFDDSEKMDDPQPGKFENEHAYKCLSRSGGSGTEGSVVFYFDCLEPKADCD